MFVIEQHGIWLILTWPYCWNECECDSLEDEVDSLLISPRAEVTGLWLGSLKASKTCKLTWSSDLVTYPTKIEPQHADRVICGYLKLTQHATSAHPSSEKLYSAIPVPGYPLSRASNFRYVGLAAPDPNEGLERICVQDLIS